MEADIIQTIISDLNTNCHANFSMIHDKAIVHEIFIVSSSYKQKTIKKAFCVIFLNNTDNPLDKQRTNSLVDEFILQLKKYYPIIFYEKVSVFACFNNPKEMKSVPFKHLNNKQIIYVDRSLLKLIKTY
jgi:hypothetical protein